MSLARRRRLVEVARERELLVLEDNPYGLLRYEGEPLPTLYSLDAEAVGRGGASDLVIYLGTFSKILSPGPAPRLGGGAAAGAREAQPRQTGRRPVLLAGHPAVRRRLLQGARRQRRTGMARVRGAPQGPLPPPARRDAGGARRALRRAGALDHPQGGLFIWATLDERIDTTDLLALARKSEGVAFVPGRAAYMDGRSGSSSMRLNFAGVPDDDIREGVRRIGKVVREQLGLLGSLTGIGLPAGGSGADGPEDAPRRPSEGGAPGRRRRAASPWRGAGGTPAPGSMSAARGRRPEGRALAGAQRLAALRARTSRTRCSGWATRWSRSTSGPSSSRSCARQARRGLHRAARARRRGRHGAGPARGDRRPYTGSGPGGLHALRPTRCSPST